MIPALKGNPQIQSNAAINGRSSTADVKFKLDGHCGGKPLTLDDSCGSKEPLFHGEVRAER